MSSIANLLKAVGGKTSTNRKRVDVDESTIGPSDEFERTFTNEAEAATPEMIEMKAAEERSASKSAAARAVTRAKVRTERMSLRCEPWFQGLAKRIAKLEGEKTTADGLHVALRYYAQAKGLSLEGGDDA